MVCLMRKEREIGLCAEVRALSFVQESFLCLEDAMLINNVLFFPIFVPAVKKRKWKRKEKSRPE